MEEENLMNHEEVLCLYASLALPSASQVGVKDPTASYLTLGKDKSFFA